MSITSLEVAAMLSSWFWPFVRISAFVSAAPVFGRRGTPPRVTLVVALMLSLAISPVLAPMPVVEPASMKGLLITVQQVVIGLGMGFALRLMFMVMELMGQIVAHLMGLGFASMVDPANGINVPVLSQFYIIVVTLVFLALDGHLLAITVLADSFRILPVGFEGLSRAGLWGITGQTGWVFATATLLALPAMATLLTVNMAFGVMTRAAPQLNIFVIGFPVAIIFGFAVMLYTLPTIVAQTSGLIDFAFVGLRGLIAGGS